MPKHEDNGAGSPYLRRPLRTLQTVLWQTARDKGLFALAKWGKVAYVNVIDPGNGKGLYFNDHGLMTAAALEAHDDDGRGYLFTVALSPESVAVLHLGALGGHLAASLPIIEPGDA